jgi:hypothetical protein
MRKLVDRGSGGPEQLTFSEFRVGVLETPTASVPNSPTSPEATDSSQTTENAQTKGVAPHAHGEQLAAGTLLYPHLYADEGIPAATALKFMIKAKEDADAAAEALIAGDLAGVSMRLGQVAVAAGAAHPHTSFNESLGMVVSYARRSALRVDLTVVSLDQLHALAKVLRALVEIPTMSLDTATTLVDDLEAVGWRGDHEDVSVLVAALLSNDEPAPQTGGATGATAATAGH